MTPQVSLRKRWLKLHDLFDFLNLRVHPGRSPTARSFWNRPPMRTRPRMPQECTNLVRRLRRQDVLELAGLLLDLSLAVHRQTVGEQPLGQSMSPDDVGRALLTSWSELHNHAAVADGDAVRLQRIVTRVHKRLVSVRPRQIPGSSLHPQFNHFLDCNAHR